MEATLKIYGIVGCYNRIGLLHSFQKNAIEDGKDEYR
jgi:hypothetical protein